MHRVIKKGISWVLGMTVWGTSMIGAATGRRVATSPAVTEHEIESAKISKQLATEGMVLLENKNQALPVDREGKIALFGIGAVQTIKGGTGSGAVNNRIVYEDGRVVEGVAVASSVLDGFKNAGYEVLTEASLKKLDQEHPLQQEGMFEATLAPDAALSMEEIAVCQRETETAIYVVRRNAGEGADREPVKGDYYLSDVERENIRLLSEHFEKCIVVLNVINIDMSWYKDSGVDAVLLMSNAGELGGDALVEVLNGTVNPSGKLVDTWASDYKDFPSSEFFAAVNPEDPYGAFIEFYNEGIYVGYRYFDSFAPEKVLYPFGYGLSYTDFEIKTESVRIEEQNVVVEVSVKNTGERAGKEVVQVYFSAPAGELDKPYQELIAFGKSDLLQRGETQTLRLTFRASDMSSYSEKRAAYWMDPGDYVLRVGNSSRHTEPAAVLCLERGIVTEPLRNRMQMNRPGAVPGGSGGGRGIPPYPNKYPEVSVESNVKRYEELAAAFRKAGASGHSCRDGHSVEKVPHLNLDSSFLEQDEGPYSDLKEGESGHDVTEYRSATTPEVEVKGVDYMTKTPYRIRKIYYDENGVSRTEKPEKMANFRVKRGSEEDGTAEYYTLLDVYNGVLTMEQLVSGMTLEELADFVEGGNKSPTAAGQSAGGTSPSSLKLSERAAQKIDDLFVRGEAGETCGLYIESRLIPNTTNADGPAGLRVTQQYEKDGVTYYQFCTAYPVGTLIAQSWDIETAYKMGRAVGADMIRAGVTLWLAPGLNIHRNPLCGRNFEYYSEDPLLSGMMASSEGLGVQSRPGIGVTYKHFVANNQESKRELSNNVVSERALREIYLRAFEIAVKRSQPMAMMSSYNLNNSVGAANDHDLLEDILRREWGFDGIVMTDWGGSGAYSDARSMHAGNDLIMAGRSVANILGYIADMAPVITADGNGLSPEGGYPHVFQSTFAFGTIVLHSVEVQWGDYIPEADGKPYKIKTDRKAFDSETRPVLLYLDEKGEYHKEGDRWNPKTKQVLETWTIREIMDGKKVGDKHVPGMTAEGKASYEEDGEFVTITYKLAKRSAKDNISRGMQEARTKDILGDDDENTLTLADLQKSVIRILKFVMSSSQFADLTQTEAESYTEQRKERLQTVMEAVKSSPRREDEDRRTGETE